jgi:hypothetical protein
LHRAHLEWTPSKLITSGVSTEPPLGELVETILRTRPHPEHGYRACLGLMRLLVRRYGHERISAACKRALATGSVSDVGVDAILKNGLDRVPVVVSHLQGRADAPGLFGMALGLREQLEAS